MKFDIKKTLELVKGGLLSPAETWGNYLGENPDWKDTLVALTAPLLLANVVLGLVLSRVMGTMSPFALGGNWFTALIFSLVLSCIGFAVAVFVFSFLAGVFGGKANFSRSFAAMSLVAIPAWIAGIIGAAVPWLGGLIALAGAIASLVFLYKIIPLALGVPDNKRVLHFIASLIVVLIINFIIASVLGVGRMPSGTISYETGDRTSRPGASNMPGFLGEMGRQAELMAQASEDSYQPPGDGMVSRQQSLWFADVVSKSTAYHQEEMERLEKLSKEIDEKENPSPADIAKAYKGMGSVISLNNVEMEIVKSNDGNWAEFQWVRQQLRSARMQQGQGSEALEHNYALYQDISDQVEGNL